MRSGGWQLAIPKPRRNWRSRRSMSRKRIRDMRYSFWRKSPRRIGTWMEHANILNRRSSRSEGELANCARLDSRGRLSLREKILGLKFCTMGDSMKRAAVILGILSLGILSPGTLSVAVGAHAQNRGQPAQQNP